MKANDVVKAAELIATRAKVREALKKLLAPELSTPTLVTPPEVALYWRDLPLVVLPHDAILVVLNNFDKGITGTLRSMGIDESEDEPRHVELQQIPR